MVRKQESIIETITKKVELTIIQNNLINDNDKIVVGVSGGPDSMCLLDTLYNLKSVLNEKYSIKFEIVVAHVNHMIRIESEDEKIFVEKFCKKLNIPFYYLKIDIPTLSKNEKISQEMSARKERYEFFEKIRKETKSNKIAVAHNLNDNVETIFLNLIRGSGLKGLTGMDYITNFVIRPLLDIEKKDILEYNILKNLNPCFDKTNEQDIYVRNKIRLKLIPTLQNEYNPNILANITRMKHILELDENFLEEYTKKIVNEAIIDNNINNIIFDFSIILKEHKAITLRSIKYIIGLRLNSSEGIENVHIMDILKLFTNNIVGKKYIIGKKFTIEIIKKNIAIIY